MFLPTTSVRYMFFPTTPVRHNLRNFDSVRKTRFPRHIEGVFPSTGATDGADDFAWIAADLPSAPESGVLGVRERRHYDAGHRQGRTVSTKVFLHAFLPAADEGGGSRRSDQDALCQV